MKSCKNKMGNSRNHLELLTEVVLGLIFVVLSCLFLVLGIPLYFYRLAVIIYAKYFRNDLNEILNGMSAYLVNDYFDNKTPRANVVIQIPIEGHVTLEELKQLVKSQWIETNDVRFTHFCQYPVRWMGFTFYKKASASTHVDNHVHLYSKSEQGTSGNVTEEDVTIFSEKLLNSSFTPFTSLWEVHLIQNFKNEKICSDSEQMSVFVFKFHHSLTDGFGLMASFVQAFSRQNVADLVIPKPRYQKKTWWKKLANCILLSFKLITECGRIVIHALRPGPWKVADENKKWNQISFRSELIPIEKLYKIKNEFGMSFSSIMYSAVSAGIHKSWQDSKNIIHNQISDSMVNHFEESSIYCLHIMPRLGHPMSLTNHLTLTFLDLPTREYDNPIERLHDVNSVLRSARDTSCLPRIIPLVSHIAGWHVYPVLKSIFKNRAVPFGVTNFAMDPLHFEINGKKAIAQDCIAGGLDGVIGAGVILLSYGKYIRVSAIVEEAVMSRKDINRFGNYIVDEIERLFSMACSASDN